MTPTLLAKHKESLFFGVILGLAGFWNAAIVIATLLIIALYALPFRRALVPAFIVGVIATGICYITQKAFIPGGDSLRPSFFWGMMADSRTFLGGMNFFWRIFGLVLFIVPVGLLFLPRRLRWFFFATLAPCFLGATTQLTLQIDTNHKFFIYSSFFYSILVGYCLCRLWELRPIGKPVAVFLGIILTITGLLDIIPAVHQSSSPLRYEMHSKAEEWIRSNTSPHDRFIQGYELYSPVFFAGRSAYLGWPYFAWSAGYDSYHRSKLLEDFFNRKDKNALATMQSEISAKYLYLSNNTLHAKEWTIDLEWIKQNYQLVFEDNETKSYVFKL